MALAEAKRLFSAGQYERSLALFRRVLSRSPSNRQARQYAKMAENAVAGRLEETRRSEEADRLLTDARSAFAQGNFEEAKRKADEALSLDGGKVEAQRLREEASVKIAESDAARKRAATRATPASRRAAAVSPVRPEHSFPAPAVPTPAPPVSAVGRPMLRLLFDAPISEGNVMVAVNDQILLRRQFSFKRKEGLFRTVKERGTVDASIPVEPGAISVKVWLSGEGIPASLLATTSAQLAAGESRILRVDYSSGRLSARVQ
jgi:tetratricopeptide (TPR) repeat protein